MISIYSSIFLMLLLLLLLLPPLLPPSSLLLPPIPLQGPSEASNTDHASEMEEGVEQTNSPQLEEEAPGDQKGNDKDEGSQEEERPMEKSHQKPAYSYAQLIVQALLASADRRQTLSNIYSFIAEQYPYYRLEDKGWKVRLGVTLG